ncbi:unnamed protein product, partial [Tetraodon nigroviridis]
EADANQNNGGVSQKPAVTDSTGAEGPRQPWSPANTADPDEATPRPHLARLFSRDAPGREDNTFKERPSESDELQTIQEHSGAASRTKMASASGSGQAAFGLGRRKKSPGLLDQIGKFFGGDKKRKGKGSFRGALSPGPQKASATSPRKRGAENAVVHFFRTIVTPAPPKSRWRELAAKMSLGDQKSQSAKAKKAAAGDGKGDDIGSRGSRSASPSRR